MANKSKSRAEEKNKTEIDSHCPILYLYIYKKMVEKFGKQNRVLSTVQIIEVWRRHIHNIPHSYEYVVLKEMEVYGLIERTTKQSTEIDFIEKALELLNKKERVGKLLSMEKWKFMGCKSSKTLKKLNSYLCDGFPF